MSLISSPAKINISDDSIIKSENASAHQQIIDDVSKNKYDSGASYVQIGRIAKTVNSVLDKGKILSDYRSLKKHSSKRFASITYIPCQECGNYVKSGLCEKCEIQTAKDENSLISYVPIRQQIKHFLRQYYREIVKYLFQAKKHDGNLKDIYDGMIWNGTERDGHIYLSLTINVDGAQCTKSTKRSLWVLQLYQNYLPPNLRYKRENILVSTIYCGENKPNLVDFIQILSNELKELRDSRKITAFVNDVLYIFIPEISLVSCDLPARAPLMGLPSFSGYNACPHCHHPGIRVKDRNGKSYIRYTYSQYPKRTQQEIVNAFLKIDQENNDAGVNLFGLKSIPPMITFHGFDIIDGFVTDHLHCVHLGVMKRLLDLWLGKVKSSKFKIPSKRDRMLLDQRLLKLKPLAAMSRLPKSVFERAFWKATHYSDLVLYNLYFAIPGILNHNVVRNFRDLSAGVYTLLKKEISETDLLNAERLLERFVKEFELIYGKDAVTMNVHLIRHLPQVVKVAGPLWAYSTFGFEGNLGRLVKSIKGTRNYSEQVCFTYCLKRIEKKTIVNEQRRLMNKFVDDELINLVSEIGIPYEKIEFYSKYRNKSGEFITSEKLIENKRNNHFIKSNGGDFFSIVAFVRIDMNDFAIARQCPVVGMEDHFYQIQPETDNFQIIRTEEIKHKMLHLQFYSREFLAKPYLI